MRRKYNRLFRLVGVLNVNSLSQHRLSGRDPHTSNTRARGNKAVTLEAVVILASVIIVNLMRHDRALKGRGSSGEQLSQWELSLFSSRRNEIKSIRLALKVGKLLVLPFSGENSSRLIFLGHKSQVLWSHVGI